MKAKNKRKFLALVLTLAMLLTMIPTTVSAANVTISADTTWESTTNDDRITINSNAGGGGGVPITITVKGKVTITNQIRVATSVTFVGETEDAELNFPSSNTANHGITSYGSSAPTITLQNIKVTSEKSFSNGLLYINANAGSMIVGSDVTIDAGSPTNIAIKMGERSDPSSSSISSSATIIGTVVTPAPVAPTITTQPIGGVYSVGDDTAILNIIVEEPDEGKLSYQWYSNTTDSATGGALIGGATSASYEPPTDTVGTAYYYCVVTNTLDGQTAETTSAVAAVTVTPNLNAPEITAQPVGGIYTVGDDVTLSIYAVSADTEALDYQWYSSTDDSPSTPEDDAAVGNNSRTCTLSASAAGTFYYYCVVTNTLGISSYSNAAQVIVNPNAPVIATQPVGVTCNAGDAMTLSVIAQEPTDGGTLSYQWYKNSTDSTKGGILISDATSASYIPSTSAAGTLYYYCVVTSTLNGRTADTISNVAAMTVTAATSGPTSISSEEDMIAFATAVNGGYSYEGVTLSLKNNVVLTKAWTPVGTEASPFMGTFDGGGHTVSGLSVTRTVWDANDRCLGLFGCVYGATLKDVTVEGSVTAGKNFFSDPGLYFNNLPYVGGLVGYAKSGAVTHISGCVNRADVIVGRGYTGGLVGATSLTSSNDVVRLSDCLNYGSITTTYIAGGNVSGVTGGDVAVGGLAGQLSGTIDRCGNYGAVTAGGEITHVVGTHGGSSYDYPYEFCQGSVGGLVGGAWSSTISDSFNKASVTGWGRKMGGLAGGLGGMTNAENCYNTGSVTQVPDNKHYRGDDFLAGIGGLAAYGTSLDNCYTSGTLSSAAYSAGRGGFDALAGGATATNCYSAADIAALSGGLTAGMMGSAYQDDINRIQDGLPLLAWESVETGAEEQVVTFQVTPSNAVVEVFTDAACTEDSKVEPVGTNTWSLQMGTYYYRVSAPGYNSVEGSFPVTHVDVTVKADLKMGAEVTFTVTPAAADFTLTTGGGQAVTPVSSADGVYTFALYAGNAYTYTVTAAGHNGVTREYTAVDGGSVTVVLTPSGQSPENPTVTGGQTISAGGVYNLGRLSGAPQGVITISTSDPVTLVGAGVSLPDVYENLYIDCTVESVALTLQDLYISNTVGATNMIDFMGAGNRLYFAGTSILDMNTGATGYAMFHVAQNAELTIGGVTPDATLYFYKREQGAGIGGNQGEYNGKITITGGSFFMKNSKQGALIGSGANAKSAPGSPGDIIIEDGILNLIPISRGAAIGGSAGNAGGATGTNVYIRGGALNINVDYSGSAVGGGGFAEGNDSDGGILYYSGGSIRTFIDHNAAAENLWPGVTTAGVNDIAITADKRNTDGESVYLLTFDTSRLSTPADGFTAEEGGVTLYSGGLHAWRYINEDLYKTDQIPINYTIDNWAPLDDPNLYLYLTGENHTLTINGETFEAIWNSENQSFAVGSPGSDYTVTVDNGISGGSVAVDPATGNAGETITVTVTPAEGKQLVAGSLKYNDGAADIEIAATDGVYSFVLPAADVTVTARFEDISTDPRYMVIPVTDESVYTVGETGGIKTMTVKAGVGGLKYFGAQLTPVIAHAGKEAVVFTHLRDGAQLSLNITKADFDLGGQAQAGFNVQAGDTVKVYIVDDLTNDVESNPTLLQ